MKNPSIELTSPAVESVNELSSLDCYSMGVRRCLRIGRDGIQKGCLQLKPETEFYEGEKICNKCDNKRLSDYNKENKDQRKRNQRNYYLLNKEKYKNRSAQWRIKNPLKRKESSRKTYLKKKQDVVTYFICDDVRLVVKIGITTCPKPRFSIIKSGSPSIIHYLGHLPGNQEHKLHDLFQQYHSHGEWFHFSDQIKQFIMDNPLIPLDASSQPVITMSGLPV